MFLILIVATIWTAVAIPVALLLGRIIATADRREQQP